MISISNVIAKMNTPVVGSDINVFSLIYVKDNGEIKNVRRMQSHYSEGTKSKVGLGREKKETKKFNVQLKERYSILLYNHDERKYNTVSFNLMTHFNGERIFH